MKEWSQVMIERMKELKPLVACFNGKGIYEIYSGGKCQVGIQPQPLQGTETVRDFRPFFGLHNSTIMDTHTACLRDAIHLRTCSHLPQEI